MMIRTKTGLLFLFATLAFTGCYKEDFSFCPPEHNVELAFRLADGGVFSQNISRVDVALFDEGGNYLFTHVAAQADLEAFEGVRLKLDPGRYRVVCWANIHGNTVVQGLGTGAAPLVTYAAVSGGYVGDGDPLYHAPPLPDEFRFEVPEKENYTGDIAFEAAHRRVNVYVKGFTDGGNTLPLVELAGVPQGAGFFDRRPAADGSGAPLLVSAGLQSALASTPSGIVARSAFSLFPFGQDNAITVQIRKPSSGEIVYSVPLNDAVDWTDVWNEITISLLIEFIDGDITVSVPGWAGSDTGTDFD